MAPASLQQPGQPLLHLGLALPITKIQNRIGAILLLRAQAAARDVRGEVSFWWAENLSKGNAIVSLTKTIRKKPQMVKLRNFGIIHLNSSWVLFHILPIFTFFIQQQFSRGYKGACFASIPTHSCLSNFHF